MTSAIQICSEPLGDALLVLRLKAFQTIKSLKGIWVCNASRLLPGRLRATAAASLVRGGFGSFTKTVACLSIRILEIQGLRSFFRVP